MYASNSTKSGTTDATTLDLEAETHAPFGVQQSGVHIDGTKQFFRLYLSPKFSKKPRKTGLKFSYVLIETK